MKVSTLIVITLAAIVAVIAFTAVTIEDYSKVEQVTDTRTEFYKTNRMQMERNNGRGDFRQAIFDTRNHRVAVREQEYGNVDKRNQTRVISAAVIIAAVLVIFLTISIALNYGRTIVDTAKGHMTKTNAMKLTVLIGLAFIAQDLYAVMFDNGSIKYFAEYSVKVIIGVVAVNVAIATNMGMTLINKTQKDN